MKIIPIITRINDAVFISIESKSSSSLIIFGIKIEASIANVKINNGEIDPASADVRVAVPKNMPRLLIANAEKSTTILNPRSPLILLFIFLKVLMNSFLIDGTNNNPKVTKLVSLNHRKAFQKLVMLSMCFPAIQLNAINIADASIK